MITLEFYKLLSIMHTVDNQKNGDVEMKKRKDLFWIVVVIALYVMIKVLSIFITGMQSVAVVTCSTLALFLVLYCAWKRRTVKSNLIVFITATVSILMFCTIHFSESTKYNLMEKIYQQSAGEVVEGIKEMPDGQFMDYALEFPRAILSANGSATYTKTKDFIVVSFPYEINFFSRIDYIYVSDDWKEDFFKYLDSSDDRYDDISHIKGEWYYVKWY